MAGRRDGRILNNQTKKRPGTIPGGHRDWRLSFAGVSYSLPDSLR
jgi:hypothetical protein